MLGRKSLILLVAIIVLSLSACAQQAPATNPDRIAQVEEQGILRIVEVMQEDEETVVPTSAPQTVTAFVGSLTDSFSPQIWLFFFNMHVLSFERYYGNVTLTTPRGQRRVREGDKLANLEYDNERMGIDRADAQRQLDQLNRNSASEAQRLRAQLEDARYTLYNANEQDWVELALKHAQAELAYERFRLNTENTRTNLQQRLTDLDNTLAGEYITAPFDGFVMWVNFVGDRFFLRDQNWPIMGFACEETFIFGISLRPDQLYVLNYGSIITISATTTGRTHTIDFDAVVVTDPWTTGERDHFTFWLRPVDLDGFMEALYAIDPYDPLYTMRNMTFNTEIRAYLADTGILLPNNAINSEDWRRFVWVYDNGNIVRRFIDIGHSIDGYTHVITGIEAGTEVVIMR